MRQTLAASTILSTLWIGLAHAQPAPSPTALVQTAFGCINATTGATVPCAAQSATDSLLGDLTTLVGAELQIKGVVGPVGPAGSTGPAGPAGQQGLAGLTGPMGLIGLTGPIGLTGVPGAAGAQGVAGPTGLKGDTGSAGTPGATGAAGTNGAAGATGPSGPTGNAGATGAAGTPGTAGATGPIGNTGPPGAAGAQGAGGPKGDTGLTGAAGTAGAVGPAGAAGSIGPAGTAGAQGVPGAAGSAGPIGQTGQTGSAGPTGAAGAAGAAGQQGVPGSTGATGPQGPQVAFGTQAAQASGVPSNVTDNAAADDGILAWLIGIEQTLATKALLAAQVDNGVLHVLGLNGVVEAFGRSLAARAGDTWNIADHGADGTTDGSNGTSGDDAALAHGFAYAAARAVLGLSTVVEAPEGNWPLKVSPTYPGFGIPTMTRFRGGGHNATIFTWNDVSNGGYSLFVSAAPIAGTTRNHDVILADFGVKGTWGPCAACSFVGGGNNAIFLTAIDGVTIDHVASRYSGAFGMTVRSSTNLHYIEPIVYYSASDGLNNDDDNWITVDDPNVWHTADDGFSAHSDIYDEGYVRRTIQINGGLFEDTHAVDIASAVGFTMIGTTIDSFKVDGIALAGATPLTAAQISAGVVPPTEGNSQGQDVLIDGVTLSNGISMAGRRLANGQPDTSDPAWFDPNDPTSASLNYIIVGALSARTGSGTYIPGENGTSPYLFWANNSNTASVPIAEWRDIKIINTTFVRRFGATNGAGTSTPQSPVFKNWQALGQGSIVTKTGSFNPSLPESSLIGPAITVYSPNFMRALTINNDSFFGLGTALYVPPGSVGRMDDFSFDFNKLVDMRSSCVDIELAGNVNGELRGNQCDGDPYYVSPNRGSIGNWANQGALTGFVITSPGLNVTENAFWNVSQDTNVNTSDPTTGDSFSNNIDYANPQIVDSYSIFNSGIGYIHAAGFRLFQIDPFPTDANFGRVVNAPVEKAPVMPTTGFYMPGETVWNSAPTPGSAVSWTRLTLSNGPGPYSIAAPTNYAAMTDWALNYGAPYTFAINGSTTATAAQCNNRVQSNDSANDTYTIPSTGLFPSCRIGIVNVGSGSYTVSGTTLVAGPGIASSTSNGITSIQLAVGRAAVHVLLGSDGVPTLYNGD